MTDHLLQCKEKLRLLCATVGSSSEITPKRLEKFIIHQFFDNDLVSAIKKRERQYIDRMTLAFRGELKRQLHDTAQQLSESRDQLSRQDKQIDFMRSQIDRRRLELETQRRKFIHEILGMHSSKGTSNAALTDVLNHAFKDDTKEDLSSSTRRGGLHEGMGLTHLAKASSEAKMKQQTEQLMKLKKRMTALQEQLNAQQEFSDSIREQRDHWEKNSKRISKW